MTKNALKDMGFTMDDRKIPPSIGEYGLRNGLEILVDDAENNKFCLCAGLDGFYDLTINNKFELEQLLKILGE